MESKSETKEKTGTGAEDLYQISLLIDQLRHDDPQMRINATKHLYQIGKKFLYL